jgi:hypothetical protein
MLDVQSTARPRHGEQALVAPYQLSARAIRMQFSNHEVNKWRGSEVESLVTISDSYEKNFDCISHACVWCVCSSPGKGRRIG